MLGKTTYGTNVEKCTVHFSSTLFDSNYVTVSRNPTVEVSKPSCNLSSLISSTDSLHDLLETSVLTTTSTRDLQITEFSNIFDDCFDFLHANLLVRYDLPSKSLGYVCNSTRNLVDPCCSSVLAETQCCVLQPLSVNQSVYMYEGVDEEKVLNSVCDSTCLSSFMNELALFMSSGRCQMTSLSMAEANSLFAVFWVDCVEAVFGSDGVINSY
eukprot:TRINITY_DN4236_c0_g2_i21.p1 TRINITY_DN4236_c0_g2~~TRINITY_DN4236_c0_g2_i21.p1  ORF type:complete len:212 (+),score=32.02 TRINITY_DN4236_c0_g2_i21:113-748(+)